MNFALWPALVRRRWNPFPDRPNGSTSLLSHGIGKWCRAIISSPPTEKPWFHFRETSPSDFILEKNKPSSWSKLFVCESREPIKPCFSNHGSSTKPRSRFNNHASATKTYSRLSKPNMKSKRKERVLGDGMFKDPRTQDVETKTTQRKNTGQISYTWVFLWVLFFAFYQKNWFLGETAIFHVLLFHAFWAMCSCHNCI